jgi:hypothetical protein
MIDNEQAAIDYFAGGLPPGWEWQGDTAINKSRTMHVSRGGSREGNVALCWEAWVHKSGITRRAYAESQCIARVREVAEAKHKGCTLVYRCYLMGHASYEFSVRDAVSRGDMEADWFTIDTWDGPTLLAAAYAACMAMENNTND